MADTSDKVDGRDDRTRLYLWILLHQGFHRGAVTAAPRPDAVGLTLTMPGSLLIEWMLSQKGLRLQNHLIDEVGGLLGCQASCLIGGILLCPY